MYVDKIKTITSRWHKHLEILKYHQQRYYFIWQTLQKGRQKQKRNTWTYLPEHHPTIPTSYDQDKIHKPNIHLQPMISCIGGATYKITCTISQNINPLPH